MKILEFSRCADSGASNPVGGSFCANCGVRTINIEPSTPLLTSDSRLDAGSGSTIAMTRLPAEATTFGSLQAVSSSGASAPETESGQLVRFASFLRRMSALAIDIVIAWVIVNVAIGLVLILERTLDIWLRLDITVWLVACCYFWIGHAFGATIGKRIVGIRVVDASGNRPGLVCSFKRCLLPYWAGLVYALSWPGITPLVLLLLLVQLLDAFRCFRHADRQTLHDRMAGTWVVRS